MGAACISHTVAEIPDRPKLPPATAPPAPSELDLLEVRGVKLRHRDSTGSAQNQLERTRSFGDTSLERTRSFGDTESGLCPWRAQETSANTHRDGQHRGPDNAQSRNGDFKHDELHDSVGGSSRLRSQRTDTNPSKTSSHQARQSAFGLLSSEKSTQHLDCPALDCFQCRVQNVPSQGVEQDRTVEESTCNEVWQLIKTIDPYAIEKTIEEWIEKKSIDADRDGVSFDYFVENWAHGRRAAACTSLQRHAACVSHSTRT